MRKFIAVTCALALSACSGAATSSSAGSSASSSSSSGGSSASSGSGSSTGTSASGSSTGSGSGGSTGASAGSTGGRPFPDTTDRIAILADQLPDLTSSQQEFAATHYVGTQKQTLAQSRPLRAINPNFLVLHYHLAMWQSAQGTNFIIDGNTWGNDYDTVTTHDDWFWHDASGARVASTADGKWLMNVSNAGFQSYWASSIAAQVRAGDYDGVFLDSAAPSLLQGETTDSQLSGTKACTQAQSQLGGETYSQAWESWITALNAALGAQGIPLIPNTSNFITSWDTTDYSLTAGAFVEGFSKPSFAESDWIAATTQTIKLASAGKIVILQNYLSSTDDVADRMYYLANYLLVKGAHTYLFYFADSTLEWYPEWDLDLGAPQETAQSSASELLKGGVYRRDFANGVVLVNPSDAAVTVQLGESLQPVTLSGGGAVAADGSTTGAVIHQSAVSQITVAAHGAEILTR